MKKFVFIAMAGLMMTAACSKGYDDSALHDRLDKVEADIEAVEAALDAYRTQVTAYQAFVAAFDNGTYVTSVEEIEGGYRIVFADGIDPIEIMNGKDGVPGQDGAAGYTPVLGITLKGDRYYWTVDGKIREDMPASPDAGSLGIKNGETPEILVKDGKWVMKTSKGEEVLGLVSDSDALVSDDVFGNVEKLDHVLKVTLANGTVMEFPLLQEYAVAIDDTSDPMIKGYRISGKFTTPSLSVFCPSGWKAQVLSAENGLAGRITLASPEDAVPGEYTFNVLVTDGTHSASASFVVTVSDNQ